MARNGSGQTIRMLRKKAGAHNTDLSNAYEAVAVGVLTSLYIGASAYVSFSRADNVITLRVYRGDDKVGTYIEADDLDSMDAVEELFKALDELDNLRVAQDVVGARRAALLAKGRKAAQAGQGTEKGETTQ